MINNKSNMSLFKSNSTKHWNNQKEIQNLTETMKLCVECVLKENISLTVSINTPEKIWLQFHCIKAVANFVIVSVECFLSFLAETRKYYTSQFLVVIKGFRY